MTKPLNPEIKALRALSRAMDSVPHDARQRCLEWLVASRCGLKGIRLPRLTTEDAKRPTPEVEGSAGREETT